MRDSARESEFERMIAVDQAARRHERDEEAWERLEVGDRVAMPDLGRGAVEEKDPDRKHFWVASWDGGGKHRAGRLEAVGR
jgi:hypothetical protein